MKKNLYLFRFLGAKFTIYYTSERPTPVCSNPSSPRYADDGDPEEFEIKKVMYDGKNITNFFYNMAEFYNIDFEKIEKAFKEFLND